MGIELRLLLDENEMLSHIFLGCMDQVQLTTIKEKYVGKDGKEKDWQQVSVKIPVTMTIGGINVNPKEFFDEWKNQMQSIILKKAQELLSTKIGTKKMQELVNRIYQIENVLGYFEEEIDWDVENPFMTKDRTDATNNQ